MTHNPGDEPMAQGHNEQNEPSEAELLAAANPEELEAARIPKTLTISDLELERLTEEARSYKDKYLRALADGENLRKRMVKEKEECSKYAQANLIAEVLHPLDNLEKALSYSDKMSEEVKQWAIGFQMILTQFKDILANHNVVEIKTLGLQFDPYLHEAVETAETDEYPAGTILEEFTRGYTMGDRTIRPARVKVSRKPKAETEPSA